MAAVTVNSVRKNVNGSFKEYLYDVTIATTGDTLATPLKKVRSASSSQVTVTAITPTAGSLAFTTTGGAVTNALINVIGV